MKDKKPLKYATLYLFLIGFIVITLMPYFWLILTSFKHRVDAFAMPPKIISTLTLQNYFDVFITKGLIKNLWNSIIIMVAAVGISMGLGLPSAFAFSRFPTKHDSILLNYLLGTKFTPFVVLALPLYLIMSRLNILDTYLGIIIAHTAFNLPFVIWMMKGFFDSIPKEIDEAARIDGYSWFETFLKIDLRLAKSGIAATTVFCAVNSWNEFLMALILTGRTTKTIPVAIPGLLTPRGTLWGQIAAVGTVVTIPVLIFSLLVQKYMVSGLTMGAVKS
ncbi:MAG: carbohydrate ABC transporter permease [Sphaerochaetaceae bacterium]